VGLREQLRKPWIPLEVETKGASGPSLQGVLEGEPGYTMRVRELEAPEGELRWELRIGIPGATYVLEYRRTFKVEGGRKTLRTFWLGPRLRQSSSAD
jgi:hypothetical protein